MILWRDRKEEEEKYCPHAAFVQVLCVLILDLFSLPIRKGVPPSPSLHHQRDFLPYWLPFPPQAVIGCSRSSYYTEIPSQI